jgi:acetolactate synthase-1/2/3 large subunit
MVKQTIDTWLSKNYVGCDKNSGLSIPNFLNIFKAYGIKSVEIKNNKEIDKKLKYVMSYKGPIMCNVKINPNARIVPKIKAGDPLEDMIPRLSRVEILKAMSLANKI